VAFRASTSTSGATRGARSTVNRTPRSKRDSGAPGVDVDVGRNARGAVDGDTMRRAARADRG
jgi:hypothetical protein